MKKKSSNFSIFKPSLIIIIISEESLDDIRNQFDKLSKVSSKSGRTVRSRVTSGYSRTGSSIKLGKEKSTISGCSGFSIIEEASPGPTTEIDKESDLVVSTIARMEAKGLQLRRHKPESENWTPSFRVSEWRKSFLHKRILDYKTFQVCSIKSLGYLV